MEISLTFRLNGLRPNFSVKHDFLDNISADSKKTLAKIRQTAVGGIKAGIVTLGTLFTGALISDQRAPWTKYVSPINYDALPLCFTGAIIASAAAMTFHSLSQSTTTSNNSFRSKIDSIRTRMSANASLSPGLKNTLIKIDKSFENGFLAYASSLACGLSILLASNNPYMLRPLILGSALLGTGAAGQTYYTLSKKKTDSPLAQIASNTTTPSAPISKNLLSKVAKSLGVGWVGCASSFGASVGVCIASGIPSSVLPTLIRGSALIGAALGVRDFRKEIPNNPSTALVARSTFAGLHAAAATFGTIGTAVLVAEQLNFRASSYLDGPSLLISALVGIAFFAKTYSPASWSAFTKRCNDLSKITNTKTPTTSPNTAISSTAISKTSLSKIAKSLGVGWVGYASSLGASVGVCMASEIPPIVLPTLIGGSALIGAALGLRDFRKKIPNNPSTALVETRLTTIASSTFAGVHAAAATFGTICIAVLVAEQFDFRVSQPFEGPSFLISTLVGAKFFAKTYSPVSNFSWSAFAKRCKELSKIKKTAILTATFMGLATLYIGPATMAKKIADTGKGMGTRVQDEFKEMVYTTKAETITKPLKEWIKSYSDIDEATRLASLSQDTEFRKLEEISCAEILQTCDLDKDDPGHRKSYKEKFKKFHPDKFENQDLAEKASQTLSRVSMVSRGKECLGKDEEGCLEGDMEITIRKEAVIPHWLYGKFMNIETACYIYPQEGEPITASLDECSSLL